jgi:hypothetical protein
MFERPGSRSLELFTLDGDLSFEAARTAREHRIRRAEAPNETTGWRGSSVFDSRY